MVGIDLFYINLDRAEDRRREFEDTFSASRLSDRWSINRFSAVDGTLDWVLEYPGTLSGPYKGNFLSHMGCITGAQDTDTHIFIAEDDTGFCSETGAIIEQLIDHLQDDAWDIIMTDVTFLGARSMPVFFNLLKSSSNIKLLDLASFPHSYVGSNSYLINRRAKKKFISVFASVSKLLDTPFDMCLAGAVRHSFLKGFLTFPFLSSPSRFVTESQADPTVAAGQDTSHHQMQCELWNALKRLFWIGPKNFDQMLSEAENIEREFANSIDEVIFKKLFASNFMLQRNFPLSDYRSLKLGPLEIERK